MTQRDGARKPPDRPLLPVDDARTLLERHGLVPRVETVPLADAGGRVLARDVPADRDLPPFDRAAVDGYAVRLEGGWREQGTEFRVLGRVAAGERWARALPPGCAVKVMTGAPVPADADGVVMVERATVLEPSRVRLEGPFVSEEGRKPGLAPRGEDARRGAPVLMRGTLLEPARIAVLASVGRVRVPVFRLPSVAVVTTGSEIVAPEARPGASQIRDGNGPLLQALLAREGVAWVVSVRHAGDELRALRRAIRGAAADVLVLTGGVSAGDLDLVPDLLREERFRTRFHKVALRPGRPLLFATRSAGVGRGARPQAAFGLPGNPVSVLATAWEFLLPYLRCAAGWPRGGPAALEAVAAEEIRRRPGLTHFVLGQLAAPQAGDARLRVREVRWNGSGDFVAAGRADCLVPLPAENPVVAAGKRCVVHPLYAGRAPADLGFDPSFPPSVR